MMTLATIDLPSAAVGALLGAALQLLLITGDRFIASWRGEFRGTWYQILPPWRNQPERIDRLTVRQRGQRIRVSVKRLGPHSETKRRWKMTGYVHGNVLVAVFYTTTPKEDSSSYGVLTLHRDTQIKESSVWRGTYNRPDTEPLDVIRQGCATNRPIVWQRKSPDNHNYAHEG